MKTNERSFQAAQNFLLAAKGFWTTTMYGRLRAEYGEQCAARGKTPQTTADVADIVEDLTTYRYFAWLERHLQRDKYAGRYGLAPYYRQRQDEVLAKLDGMEDDSRLELQPELKMPAYYMATDIHQHPGGVWSEPTAGLVYEHGARSTTTPLLGQAPTDVHTRFTEQIGVQGEPRRVLDMGCGFGKSTLPFARRFPQSKVQGVDLAAPCLRVGAFTARQEDLESVRFRQFNAAETGFDEGSFDLVTSTMFLHEQPLKVIDEVLDECFRLLEPGGRMVHLDFWYMPDPFTRFIHYGHARRNNEPYMQPLAEFDLTQALSQRGFIEVKIEPFSEFSGALAGTDVWRFPWTVISARKPQRASAT
ncbi:MAG: class I SAM-dependent methyltransferase [Rhodanobacter sp.]